MDPCRECDHEPYKDNPGLLWQAFLITAIFGIVEFAASRIAESTSLLADAFHMAAHAASYTISLGAMAWSRRRGEAGGTRIKLWMALLNTSFFLVLAAYISWEAYRMYFVPREILSGLMFVVAAIGLGVNAYVERMLRHGAKHDANIRGQHLHVWGDYISSVGVIAAAIAIYLKHWVWADALAAVIVGAVMLYTGVKALRGIVRKLRDRDSDST